MYDPLINVSDAIEYRLTPYLLKDFRDTFLIANRYTNLQEARGVASAILVKCNAGIISCTCYVPAKYLTRSIIIKEYTLNL